MDKRWKRVQRGEGFIMAYARMLHRSIAIDSRFNELSIKEQWLFMRLLPFADDEGKLTGNTTELRALTLPLAPIKNEALDKMLEALEGAGLILWNKGKLVQYTGWSKNQKIGHRPKASILPDYIEEERKQLVGKGETTVKKVKKSSSKFTPEELEEFTKQFPEKDIPKAYEGWVDYLASSGKSYKDYKAAFRNTLRRDWTPKKKSENGEGNGEDERFYQTPSGLYQGFCKKCGKRHFYDEEWKIIKASCHGRSLANKREKSFNEYRENT